MRMNTMQRNHWTARTVAGAALAVLVLGCVTVNVYFPEAAVKDLSEQIEEAVARQAESNAEAEEDGAPQAALGSRLVSAVGWAIYHLGASPVYASESDVAAPEISNPAIRRIIQSRASRVEEVNRFKSRGVLGEGRDALLAIRSLDELALAERAAVQRLVKQENNDREEMFKEIAAATGASLSQLPQIRETYAATLREKARPGDWIERPGDGWVRK